jgi:hypothetical protein
MNEFENTMLKRTGCSDRLLVRSGQVRSPSGFSESWCGTIAAASAQPHLRGDGRSPLVVSLSAGRRRRLLHSHSHPSSTSPARCPRPAPTNVTRRGTRHETKPTNLRRELKGLNRQADGTHYHYKLSKQHGSGLCGDLAPIFSACPLACVSQASSPQLPS